MSSRKKYGTLLGQLRVRRPDWPRPGTFSPGRDTFTTLISVIPMLTFAYDAAKRPTAATATLGSGTLSLTQTYDRTGNVTADGRTMPAAVTGDAGTRHPDLQLRRPEPAHRLLGPRRRHRHLHLRPRRQPPEPDHRRRYLQPRSTTGPTSSSRSAATAASPSPRPTPRPGDLTADPETGTTGIHHRL